MGQSSRKARDKSVSGDLEELIRQRLSRAKDGLNEARLLFEHSHLRAALNRCYYATFYAATALLLTKNKSSSKHSGTLSLFKSQMVKTRVIPVETARFYLELYKYRLKVDYDDYVELKALEVLSWLDKSTQFVKQVDGIVERLIT